MISNSDLELIPIYPSLIEIESEATRFHAGSLLPIYNLALPVLTCIDELMF